MGDFLKFAIDPVGSIASKISPQAKAAHDWVSNPIGSLAKQVAPGTTGTAVSALFEPADALALADQATSAGPTPTVADAPPPPTPLDPAVAAAMNKAAQDTRNLGRGRASTYLASPSLLDRPGTFFKNSLGG